MNIRIARKGIAILTLALLLPLAQAAAQSSETQTQSFTNGRALFPFANNVTFKILGACSDGTTATVTLSYDAPNTLRNLLAPEVAGSCIARTGTKKCPRFDWTASTCSPPFQVRIFYVSDNPLSVNPRIAVCDNGFCVADLDGYFPFAPSNIGPDPGYSATTSRNSTFFAATLNIPAGAQGFATILDPLGNNTTMTNPLVVNGGQNLPLKVLLCFNNTSDPALCDPITDAQILVSIYLTDPFEVVLPLAIPGQSFPPAIMEFVGPYYQQNWKVPGTPGLYNISFIFLTSNANILTAFVRVPTP
ncbi:MAG: hypothetical protein ACRD35_08245 [Candidatus Acidiferrales bacterium]